MAKEQLTVTGALGNLACDVSMAAYHGTVATCTLMGSSLLLTFIKPSMAIGAAAALSSVITSALGIPIYIPAITTTSTISAYAACHIPLTAATIATIAATTTLPNIGQACYRALKTGKDLKDLTIATFNLNFSEKNKSVSIDNLYVTHDLDDDTCLVSELEPRATWRGTDDPINDDFFSLKHTKPSTNRILQLEQQDVHEDFFSAPSSSTLSTIGTVNHVSDDA